MIQFALTVNEQELELLQMALQENTAKMESGAEFVPAAIQNEYRKQAAACDDLFYKSLNVPPIGVTEDFDNV